MFFKISTQAFAASRTLIYLKKDQYLEECYSNIYKDILLIKGNNNLKYRKDIGLKYIKK